MHTRRRRAAAALCIAYLEATMGFRMFSPPPSPIAIDFGSSSVKMLQVDPRESGGILAAAELPIPDDVRQDPSERLKFVQRHLAGALKAGGFKGRRAVCAVPTAQTILQHMQIAIPEGVKRDAAVKSQLQIAMGVAPHSVVVRSHEVAEINREGQPRTEVICIAIPRELIMRHIAMLETCRLEVTGVHAQASTMLRAFDYLHRREDDQNLTTMYIDLGYSSTCVVIGHGCKMMFARAIQIGGLHFDQHIAKALKTDMASARAHRLSLADSQDQNADAPAADFEASDGSAEEGHFARLKAGMARAQTEPEEDATAIGMAPDRRSGRPAPGLEQNVPPGEGPKGAANVDFSELLETIADEMSMCLRYHRGLFPTRTIDRVVLLGGEARQTWLCRHIAKALRCPAKLGDPLSQFPEAGGSGTPSLDRSTPQPGWSTVCGLCTAEA